MNTEKIRSLVEDLSSELVKHDVGFKNVEAIRCLELLLSSLEFYCVGDGYLEEKVAKARHWLDTMFSERKHLKYGGAEEVANRFRSTIILIVKKVDSSSF